MVRACHWASVAVFVASFLTLGWLGLAVPGALALAWVLLVVGGVASFGIGYFDPAKPAEPTAERGERGEDA